MIADTNNSKQILESVLKGVGNKSHLEVVALNVALVLWVAGVEDNIKEGINMALSILKKGEAWDKFLKLKNYLEV